MRGVLLPGNSQVVFQEFPVPEPGYGQVLIKMKASSICGSDLRAIYREHLGHGPEGYQGVIAGHEPCGQIVELGPGCKQFKAGIASSCITSAGAASATTVARAT